MIAGQSGETQWALHPDEGNYQPPPNMPVPASLPNAARRVLVPTPVRSRFNLDRAVKPPYGPRREPANPALNLTFASPAAVVHGQQDRQDHPDRREPGRRPAGRAGRHRRRSPAEPDRELGLVPGGLRSYETTVGGGKAPVRHNPVATPRTDYPSSTSCTTTARNISAMSATTPRSRRNLHGLRTSSPTSPARPAGKGGVFYVRGGYGNNDGLVPLDRTRT